MTVQAHLASGESQFGSTDTREPGKHGAVPPRLSAPLVASCMETADSYDGIIVKSGRYRIIRCKDDLQWIIQRRKGGQRSKWPWTALAYIYNEDRLPSVLRRPTLRIPPEDTAVLMAATRHLKPPPDMRR